MKFGRLYAALVLSFYGIVSHAQGWSPQKNVEIVVLTVPGGTNDKLARSVERAFTSGKLVSSTVAVVHKAGAGGQIAYAYVAPRVGDPHYLVLAAPSLLTAHIIGSSKLNYTDFTPFASIFNDYIVLAVNAGSAVKGGKDLIARLRTEPQAVTLGFSSSLGNHHHIAAGLLMTAIGGRMRELKPVIFKGSAEAVVALLGNHLELVSTGAGNAVPHMASGKLRIVGVSAGERLPGAMSSVPTWKEQGVNLVYGSWRAILGPKGLTPEQVAFWENALRKASATAEWKAELERYYWSEFFVTGAALRTNLEKEYTDSKAVLAELGLVKP